MMTVGLSAVVRLVRPGVYAHWCPGCDKAHLWNISSTDHPQGKRWGWDGDLKLPSVEPDLAFDGCNYLLRGGVLYYFQNCKHHLVGQAVPLPVFPERHI